MNGADEPDDEEREQIAKLGRLLLKVSPLHQRFFALRELGPAPGSRAMSDVKLPLGAEVRAGAITAVNSSLDHLVSWATLVLEAGQLPAFAHFTLLRSTVEAASTARWLVEEVDERVRVARGIGNLLADLRERNKLERVPRPPDAPPLPPPEPGSMTAAQRIADVEEKAAAAGLCPLWIGHTEAVARYGLGEFAYRLLCAFAHGGQAIPFAASHKDKPDERDAGGLRVVRMTGDIGVGLRITEASVALARLAAREVFAYHGHNFAAQSSSPAGADGR